MGFLDSKIKTLDNGKQVLEIGDSVNFGIVTKDNKLILCVQSRAGSNSDTVNLFGGYIEKNEDYETAIIREMQEESNVSKDDIQLIHYLQKEQYVSVGYTNERSTIAMIKLNKNLSELDLRCNDPNEATQHCVFDINGEVISGLYNKCSCMKLFWFLQTLLLFLDAVIRKEEPSVDFDEKNIVWN